MAWKTSTRSEVVLLRTASSLTELGEVSAHKQIGRRATNDPWSRGLKHQSRDLLLDKLRWGVASRRHLVQDLGPKGKCLIMS